ncbi:MAG: hypothetical protein I8H75_01175 [Myxococcaceae bacterium]|nr:hypothetical protein [Myxococcaceae bacterium]MBH2005953.1 hypothetical protein [Myxococcaceae bacterium]
MKFIRSHIDYVSLIEQLKGYRNPRDKIKHLLKNQSLVRVKKGLYIAGDSQRQEPVCLEALANLIYGPSYISYEYALSYYGLIPERTPVLTCATTQKSKGFDTPLGCFRYQHLSFSRYSVGVLHNNQFLIASAEKALSDLVARQKLFSSKLTLHTYLVDDLRLESETLQNLDSSLLKEIASQYRNPNVRLLESL